MAEPGEQQSPEQQKETQVRQATESDLPDVYRMMCQLEEHELDPDVFKQKYTENLRNPSIHYLVAAQEDRPIGFISLHMQPLLHHDGKVAEIQELIVDPTVRSQGTGKKLVEQARQLAIANNCESFEVTTNTKRLRTQEFYAKNGFTQTHVKFTEALPKK
jgi:PhnO protein